MISPLILAIESSCDDSCISVVSSDFEIIYEKSISQIDVHKNYGGVVPELASRCHLEYLQMILQDLEKNIKISDINAVCATFAPGLIGGLLTGIMIAKGICHASGIKFIPIHHLEGHLESVNIGKTSHVKYPNLTLLVSGGHCQFVLSESFGKYRVLGKTIDDSVGEAFDKSAKMLGLSYPGGPIIEKLAQNGRNIAEIGKPMSDNSLNFSFSGFKTNVLNYIQKNPETLANSQHLSDVCFTVQDRICANLELKTQLAIDEVKKICPEIKDFTMCGGVSANRKIISKMQDLCSKNNLTLHFPSLKYATDNATMIAFAGVKRYNLGVFQGLDISPKSRISIENI
ncbi:tRNA (adenosine(37)-N6)-threonylcarbamoyltransferase complex transferase subunit TsaD [Candidatus Deianiraea vastatrix]|uniref:tRNA N6-adenosine threonylcarbamoyltransferase n=1 Tax=Candidatus Deianiraea vastatrix TaxID=2163644 RepID=A0A5B8XI74_9RICK|nr:tRNA (adenosine(37)-N6)-threonylcarbamoyltransferase complex transferase subunit TsaD [Candidatus Deianiraea vastatrix]QED23437.1 tRNA N6-adenosine threonylcarbamoyltransferase [Candidatus Deianiraea vastatrix]